MILRQKLRCRSAITIQYTVPDSTKKKNQRFFRGDNWIKDEYQKGKYSSKNIIAHKRITAIQRILLVKINHQGKNKNNGKQLVLHRM